MLLGAHEAGVAIEHSMLGATHACANPLTAHFGTIHGMAIAVLLPHVVRWNAQHVGDRYGDLLRLVERDPGRRHPNAAAALGAPVWAGARLADRLAELAQAGDLPASLRNLGVARNDLPTLADEAATQWTGTFNPRPFDAAAALEIYERAY